MLSSEEIAAFIDAGYEIRGVEFKGPGSTSDKAFVANVARAAIALANQADGGHIIIGLNESKPQQSGLSEVELAEWNDYDTVVDKVNRYADPPLRVARAIRPLPNGGQVVVLQIEEFEEVPVLAARDYPGVIQLGQLYTRSLRKPESSASHTQNEMRSVLDLATRKQLARFLRLANGAGIELNQGPTDNDKYLSEEAAAAAAIGIQTISSGAHLAYTIRPAIFEQERVEFNHLVSSMRDAAVSARGWPYPYVSNPLRGANWIYETNEFMHHESWAAFESGQVVSWHRISEDSDGRWDRLGTAPPGQKYLPVWLPVANFTEVFAFALRYQRIALGGAALAVKLSLQGAAGWRLTSGDVRRHLYGNYDLQTNDWSRTVHIEEKAYETASATELAVKPSLHLLHRFGWAGANNQIIEAIQRDAFEGKSLR